MSIIEVNPDKSLSRFSPSDAAIAMMKAEFLPLVINDPNDKTQYDVVHNARLIVKSHRCNVEKTRKELKSEALEWGRTVDAEAKRITALIEPIELHLQTQEKVYTDEQERKKNAERLRLEAEEKARRDAEKAARDAENARIKAEQDAEYERLRQLRVAMEKQQQELAAAQQAMEAERQRLTVPSVEPAKQEISLPGIKTQEPKKVVQADPAVAAVNETACPVQSDKEKLLSVADTLASIEIPDVSAAAAETAQRIKNLLDDTVMQIIDMITEGVQ